MVCSVFKDTPLLNPCPTGNICLNFSPVDRHFHLKAYTETLPVNKMVTPESQSLLQIATKEYNITNNMKWLERLVADFRISVFTGNYVFEERASR